MPKRYRPLLFSFILSGIAVVLLIAAVIPSAGQIILQRRSLADQYSQLEQLNEKYSALSGINSGAQKEIVKVSVAALPIKLPFQQALAILENLSAKHPVAVKEISAAPAGPDLGISFSIIGSLENIRGFLDAANNVLPVSEIGGVLLAGDAAAASDSAAVYRGDLLVKVKWEKEPEAIGKISQQLPLMNQGRQATLDKIRSFETFSYEAPADAVKADNLFPE